MNYNDRHLDIDCCYTCKYLGGYPECLWCNHKLRFEEDTDPLDMCDLYERDN